MTTTIKEGIYQHYKGNFYRVLGVAIHTETKEQLVVYCSIYDGSEIWVRPLQMFLEEVEIAGAKIKRFQYIKR